MQMSSIDGTLKSHLRQMSIFKAEGKTCQMPENSIFKGTENKNFECMQNERAPAGVTLDPALPFRGSEANRENHQPLCYQY